MTTGGTSCAAFFDLDKTVIARSSTLAFTAKFHAEGLITRRDLLRGAYARFFFQASGADHDQMERMREHISKLSAGWEVQQVRDIVAETLAELITPLVYEEATALIAEHHEAGRDVVLVSASGSDVVEPIGVMLGVDRVVATTMVIDEEGRYTGDLQFYAYGENKAVAVRALADEQGYDLAACYAYSDSATDLPMLQAVGHPHAVNPDRALRREAQSRDWPVLSFQRPVSLRSRFPHPATGRTGALSPATRNAAGAAAATAATAAATAGLVWYASRRPRREGSPV